MIEIERKFLVLPDALLLPETGVSLSQWYIMRGEDRSLRVRKKGDRFILTVKSGKGLVRTEIERDLTAEEAKALIAVALEAPVEKTRYQVPVGRHTWEVDVFEARNAGLVMAEIELSAEDERIDLPAWAGLEVTSDPRFQNTNLARAPIDEWREQYETIRDSETSA